MTLYRNTALGVSPSGRAWSFRIYHSSAASLATVEADWLAQITSFWTKSVIWKYRRGSNPSKR